MNLFSRLAKPELDIYRGEAWADCEQSSETHLQWNLDFCGALCCQDSSEDLKHTRCRLHFHPRMHEFLCGSSYYGGGGCCSHGITQGCQRVPALKTTQESTRLFGSTEIFLLFARLATASSSLAPQIQADSCQSLAPGLTGKDSAPVQQRTHALKLIMKDCVPRGVSRGEAQCQPAPPRDSLAHGQSDPTGLNRQEGDGKRAISSQLVVQGAPFRSSDPGSKARWTWWSVEGPLTTV